MKNIFGNRAGELNLTLIVIIFLVIVIACCVIFCEQESKTNIQEAEGGEYVEIFENQTSSKVETDNQYSDVGLRFGEYNAKTSYNGYTYELVRSEKQNQKFQYKSILYRYKDESTKEELYDFDSSGTDIIGIFIDNYLYYIQDADTYDHPTSLKKMDLETLMVEILEADNNYINGIFQYDNYIFLPCCRNIISFDVITGSEKEVISSSEFDEYKDMRSSNVFACNDKLWIIRRFTNKEDSKVFCSDLDGSNLMYAGFAVPNFYEIISVNESISEIEYYTNEREVKRMSLND